MTIRRYDKRNYHSVGIVIDDGQEEDQNISYCVNCYKVGVLTKLKGRVYLDMSGKLLVNPPPDAEDWLQCWTCGYIIAVREAQRKGRISGILGIEPVDNPYNYGKGVILGNDSKNRYQRLKGRQNKHQDQEAQKLIDQGWEITNYQQYIST